uniref:Uncharacterized protein n=1 Tax=Anguilla anguilla TaxID=7936 RepID=A0A0E9PMY9_ANGAN
MCKWTCFIKEECLAEFFSPFAC